MTGSATVKWLPYADKGGKKDETGGKIAPIRQEMQAEVGGTHIFFKVSKSSDWSQFSGVVFTGRICHPVKKSASNLFPLVVCDHHTITFLFG